MPGKKGRSGGHNKKPTAVLKAEGTYRPDRHGRNGDNVPADGWPEKPAGLTPMQERLWDDVVTYLPASCLGSLDTASLRDMVRLYGIYTDLLSLVEQDPTDQKTLNACFKAFDRFWKYAQDYGLTPVARSRLQVPKNSDDDNPLEALKKLMESRN